MDQILEGHKSESVKEKLTRSSKLDLKTTLNMCRAMELNEENKKVVMNKSKSEISKVSHYSGKKFEEKRCKFCSRNHRMVKSEWPAWGNSCNSCHKPNHFAGAEVCESGKSDVKSDKSDRKSKGSADSSSGSKTPANSSKHGKYAKKNIHMVDDESSDSSTEGSVSVITDGLIFRSERLVIPKELRKSVLSELHVGHTGIDGSLRRAHEIVYWPGMTNDMREHTQKCETCREFEHSQAKEPLMNHELPSRPWQKVGVDLLHVNKKDYLVTVDYN